MPSASKHKTKANSNLVALGQIDIITAADWAAVIAFYTAVHLIEQLRALDGRHSINHLDRNEYVKNNHVAIHEDYRSLYDLSKIARYDSNEIFYRAIQPEEVQAILIDVKLKNITEYVDKYIAGRP